MKTIYYDFTRECLHKKDSVAEDIKNNFIVDYLMTDDYELCFKVNYEKQNADIEKLQKLQNEILNESLKFDNCIQQFKLEIPNIIFIGYDNISMYVSIICYHYKICNDIRNIILSFAIDKTVYNREKRQIRKHKKLISSNYIDGREKVILWIETIKARTC